MEHIIIMGNISAFLATLTILADNLRQYSGTSVLYRAKKDLMIGNRDLVNFQGITYVKTPRQCYHQCRKLFNRPRKSINSVRFSKKTLKCECFHVVQDKSFQEREASAPPSKELVYLETSEFF